MADHLFGIDLAAVFESHFAPGVHPATLTVVTPGTRTPGSLTDGTQPTTAAKTCRGVVELYTESQIDGTIVQQGDRRIVLVADTIEDGAIPKPNDTITIQGETHRVVNVDSDGGGAVYVCQGRRK